LFFLLFLVMPLVSDGGFALYVVQAGVPGTSSYETVVRMEVSPGFEELK